VDTKQKITTLSENLTVICKAEANLVTSLVETANRLELAPSLLSRIMSNKNKIIEGKMKC
jgi:hypothetical protein